MGAKGSQQQVTEKLEDTPKSPRAAFASRNSRSWSGGGRLTRSFSSLDLTGKGRNIEQLEAFLGQVPLLKCLPKSKLTLLAEAGQKKKYVIGAVIIQKGEQGDCFYIVQQGEAEVVREGAEEDEDDETIVVLSKGDFFGERALLTMDVRAATVRAASSCTVFEISREIFDELGLRDELDFRGRNAIRVDGHHTVTMKPASPKTPADRKFILNSLATNANISQFLNVHSMPQLTNPAWKEDITVGEEVIRQGDTDADYCYIINSGEFAVIVDGKVVGHLSKGQCFGELSLLYAAPRTATIAASKNSSIWVLPRGWIKTAAQESAQIAAKKRLVFLNHVPALDLLLQDEKQLLAPLLSECHMQKSDKIVGFGDEEAAMYVLTDGSARILEDDSNAT